MTISAYDRCLYSAWINDNVPANCAGLCEQMTSKMVEDFPELIRVRGHYHDSVDGIRPHWWCKTAGGDIVDPTAWQFPSSHVLLPPETAEYYHEHDETKPEPTGKCVNCGEYCYEHRNCCSDKCSKEAVAFLQRVQHRMTL